MTLAELKRGQTCRVVRVGGSGRVRRRILDMGVTAGAMIEVQGVAPLGDPIHVKVKGYHLSLRKEEATHVEVELD